MPSSFESQAGADVTPAVRHLYSRAIVIDALASPDTFNIPLPPPGELTPQKLACVRESGISAINLTVGFQCDVLETVRDIAFWLDQIDRHHEHLRLVRRAADIDAAAREGRLGVILGFQGLDRIAHDLDLLAIYAGLGVKIMQLTYNGRNAIGSGCGAAEDDGLSPLGHDTVRRLNALGVLLDLSHAGTRTALDAVRASARPVAITHTGARAVHHHPRNQPDEVLRAVAERGGVTGLYLMPFLGRDPVNASRALVLRHLQHLLDVCGEDHVGIGSDQSISPVDVSPAYRALVRQEAQARADAGIGTPGEHDVVVTVPELNSPRRLELIAADLDRAGHPPRVIEKVIGGNFRRLFGEAWQGGEG